ncbi:DUF2200 family protein [Nocardioides conyzicola]|uniref:DUF2200 family protein n=1 Tax=Nocardioides conyzicola TaxID=1651781 RepID=UPI0031ED8479
MEGTSSPRWTSLGPCTGSSRPASPRERIRYLDKLVDELAKGRPMEKVLRA